MNINDQFDIFIAYHGDEATGSQKQAQKLYYELHNKSLPNGRKIRAYFHPITNPYGKFSETPRIVQRTPLFVLVVNENVPRNSVGQLLEADETGTEKYLYGEVDAFRTNYRKSKRGQVAKVVICGKLTYAEAEQLDPMFGGTTAFKIEEQNVFDRVREWIANQLKNTGTKSVQQPIPPVNPATTTPKTVPPSVKQVTPIVNYDKNEFNISGTTLIKYLGSKSDVQIPYGITKIGDRAFKDNIRIKTIDIPDTVSLIDDYAFDHCTNLTRLTIPDGVTEIGTSVVGNCKKLEAIYIGKNLSKVGLYFLHLCNNLKSINVSSDNKILSDKGNCLIDTKTHTLLEGCQRSVIPLDANIVSIRERAFTYRYEIEEIVIPSSVTHIAQDSFDYMKKLTNLVVADDNIVYHSSGNCVIETKNKTLVVGCNSSIIPNDGSVTCIAANAFSGSNIPAITIPDSIEKIEKNAFDHCLQLVNVQIPQKLVVDDYVLEEIFGHAYKYINFKFT